MLNKKRYESKVEVFIFVSILVLSLTISLVSASRLPIVGSDSGTWGTILNEYLSKALGDNATTLNVSGDATFNTDVIISGTLYGVSPVKIAGGINLTTGNMSIGGIQVWERGGCLATRHFTTIGENGEAGYIKIANGTSPIHNESGAGLIWVQNDKLYFQQSDRTNIEITNQTGNYLNLSGTNANQDINISPYNFEVGNLTLAQKITFAFGEIIDNIIDGWIRITGNLNVTGNATFNERVGIGTNSPSAKLFIDGNTDEIQTIIQAYSSQTSDIFVIEESDGTDIISLDRYGHFYFKPVTDSDGISVDGGNINARNLLRLKSFNEQDDTSDAGILSIEHEKSSGLIGNITSINIDMITTESGSGYNLKGMNIVMNNDANSIGLRIEDTETEIEFADTIANIRISNILNFDSNTFVINASSNRIGIGTTTPDEILHLFGNSAALKLEDDSGNDATINVGNSQLTLSADPDNAIASTDIVFKMDGSEVARFYQGGNFGIGTTSTGGDGQLSLGESSEEGCFRYNSNKDSLEFSHQCNNNFSLISDAGFYGSLHWIATANCAVGTAGGFTSPTTFTADSDCDDNARTSRGLTTSNLAVGNAEGRKPQIKFDSLPAGYYNVILHGNFRGTATDVDCSYMMTIDSGAINSSLTGMTAAAGSAGMSPVVSGLLYVPTDRGASTIELYGGESAANCRIQITSTELEIIVYYYPQYNSTTGADYAEWFEKENELILAGDLIGLNVETGKVRVWRYADPIIGIASNNPSVAGNYKPGIENTHALVGLVGQLDLNEPRIIIKKNVVYSPDGQFIGYKLSNGKVFIK